MADEQKFNPSQPGALRVLHGPRWKLEQDFAQPTLDMLASGRNLRMFEKEEPTNYEYRKYNSCPLDMIPDAISMRVDNLFRVAPERKFKESPHRELFEQIIADADNDGTALDTFMQRALWMRCAMGADIVTQMTAGPVDDNGRPMPVETEAEAKAAGLRPFFLMFNPLQKVDWATSGAGRYTWVRYSLGEKQASDEQACPPGIREFLSLTPETWTRWVQKLDEKGKPAEEMAVPIVGDHPPTLGIVPVIKLYFSESLKAGEGCVPMALITRAAVVARCLLNLKSQADMDLLASVARWLMTGYSGDNAPTSLGPMTMWVSENPEAKVSTANGGVDQIEEKRAWVTLYVTEILRLLKFRGGMGDTEGNQGSGVKLALEMTDLRNELLATADQMEAAEVEMMRQAVVMATGQDVTADEIGYGVLYNKDFVLDSAADLLAHMKAWLVDLDEVAVKVPSVTKAMVARLSSQFIRSDAPEAEVAAEEVEALVDVDVETTGAVEE